MAMTPTEAHAIIGGCGSRQMIGNMRLALSMGRNTPAEAQRLEAATVALRNWPAYQRAAQAALDARHEKRMGRA